MRRGWGTRAFSAWRRDSFGGNLTAFWLNIPAGQQDNGARIVSGASQEDERQYGERGEVQTGYGKKILIMGTVRL